MVFPVVPVWASGFPGNAHLDNVTSGLLVSAPASPTTPFNADPQRSELVKHSDVPVDIGQAAFACNGARWEQHAAPLAESAHVSGLRGTQAPLASPRIGCRDT